MLEKKRDCILKYYDSINTYSNYLIKYFNDENYSLESSKLNEIGIETLLSLISLNLIYKKEDIIENQENLEYDSKLYDFVLDDYLAIIGVKNKDEYKIGNFKSKHSSTIFAKIRNKLAHGDFYVEDRKIYLNIEGEEYSVDIVIFSKFMGSLTRCYLNCNKENIYERNFIVDKATSSNIPFEINNIESLLKLLTIKSYKITSYDNEVIPINIKNLLNNYIDNIKRNLNNKEKVKILEDKLVKTFDELGYNISIHNRKIKDIEKFKKIALPLVDMDYSDKEKKYSFAEMIDNIVNLNYGKDLIWMGLYFNQQILENMLLYNEYDLKKIYNLGGISNICNLDELYIPSLLAKFNVLYAYPLDDIYKENNVYKIENERLEELDFGLLNLGNIKPNYMNYELKIINELEKQINSLKKQIDNFEKRKDDLKVSYTKVKDLNVKNKIQGLILNCETDLSQINIKYKNLIDRYLQVLHDVNKNEKYFYNRNIVEGIRNALAHGNVKIINSFEVLDINDIILNFKDYDEEMLCMDLSLTIRQFNNLFSEENVNVLSNFINSKIYTKK